jgi:hypothetical protein
MSALRAPVSEMLVIVKSRETQRAMLAEMQGNRAEAERHFLAAAHLELVLADDYTKAGDDFMAFRSRSSAAAAFWRSGHIKTARKHYAALARKHPKKTRIIKTEIAELNKLNVPPSDSNA